MLLQTERLTIRRVAAEDWSDIKQIWLSFQTSAFARYDLPHSTDDGDVRPRIAKWAACGSGMEHMFFAVCLQKRVIGYIAFNQRERGYEIGYCFHSDFHGKGFAKESHLALFAHLNSLGITVFSARTALANTPSVALLRSLGFRQTGVEKVSFYKDENGSDIVFEGGIFERG